MNFSENIKLKNNMRKKIKDEIGQLKELEGQRKKIDRNISVLKRKIENKQFKENTFPARLLKVMRMNNRFLTSNEIKTAMNTHLHLLEFSSVLATKRKILGIEMYTESTAIASRPRHSYGLEEWFGEDGFPISKYLQPKAPLKTLEDKTVRFSCYKDIQEEYPIVELES